MIVFGKDKEAKDLGGGSFKELEEFSEDLMELAKKIEEGLKKKREIEEKIGEKDKVMAKLRKELFQLKEELMKANLGLARLEERRQKVDNPDESE